MPQAESQASVTIQLPAPIGGIMPFWGAAGDLSDGWLLCDGSSFSRDDYPKLCALLGGKTTTPDLRGYFLRGLDPTGAVDPDRSSRVVGSVQADEFKSHDHQYTTTVRDHDTGGFAAGEWGVRGTVMTGAAGGNETRPKNVAVNYIIFAGLPGNR